MSDANLSSAPDAAPPPPAPPARGHGGGRDLTQGPITRTLIAFMLPTLLSSVLQSLNGSINSIWIGRLLGEQALAASVNAGTIMFLLTAFMFGFSMAATILIGQAIGRRDAAEARVVLGSALGFFALVAGAMALIGYAIAPDILRAMATPPEAEALALAYLRLIFIATPPMMLMTLLMAALRGAGDAVTPLWFMALAVLLDAGLNPLLIAGIGPLPALGIAGSAVATIIANLAALIGLLIALYARRSPLALSRAELSHLRLRWSVLRTIMVKGLPMGLQLILISTSALVLMGLVNRYGVHTAAAYGVVTQLWTYVQMPAMAVGAAVSAMVAQSIGAGKWDRVAAATRSGVGLVSAVTLIMVAALALADRPALALFLGGDSPAIPIARHIQLIGTWSYVMFGVMFVLFGTMRANGSVWPPLLILAVGLVLVRFAFIALSQTRLGADAIWWSLPAGSLVNLALAVAYYRSGRWKRARMR